MSEISGASDYAMSDVQSWGTTCAAAYKQPLSQLLATNWGMAGFLIVSFALSASVSFLKFIGWFRTSLEERKALWRLFGYFTACCFAANFFGALAFLANAQMLDNFFRAYNVQGISMGDKMSFKAISNYWETVHFLCYSIEFLFLSCAMLMVLNRMLEFSLRVMHVSNHDSGRLRPMAINKAVIYAVTLINIVGFIGNIVTTAFNFTSAELYLMSAANFNSNQNVTALEIMQRASIDNDKAQQAASVQQFCEVASLIIIIVSFAGTGIYCISSVASVKNDALISSTVTQSMHPKLMNSFQRLKIRIFGTVFAVFLSFLARACFSILNAVAASGVKRGDNPDCDLCDDTCLSVYDLIYVWLGYTPQFQLSMEFLSCPLASLIALWGMTASKSKKQQHAVLESSRSGAGASMPYFSQ